MPQLNDQSRSHTALKQGCTLIAVLEMSQPTGLSLGSFPGWSDTRSKRSSQMRLRPSR